MAELDAGENGYQGDMVILERGLSPQEAQILCDLLRTADIQADTGDANLVQAHSFLSIAVGGAKLRVPVAQLAAATDMVAAYRRGEFELGEDFDVGGN